MTQISGDSIEAVAFGLLEAIALAEKWGTEGAPPSWNKSRAEILAAYTECLTTVRGDRIADKVHPDRRTPG